MASRIELVLLLVEKELKTQLRTKQALIGTLLFVVLTLFIFQFSFAAGSKTASEVAPGLIWVVVAFSGTIALSQIFSRDHDDRVSEGIVLSGIGGMSIFFSKWLAGLFFMLLIECLTVPLFMLFFHYAPGLWLAYLIQVLLLGTIGYVALGTLFTGLLGNARMRDLLLPVILYPMIIPWFIISVKASEQCFAGEYPTYGNLLLGFDFIFVTAAALLYDFVAEEPI